jgi:hypothetical protein
MVLLVALSTCGYRLTFSPSASTGHGTKPSATPSTGVLAPQARSGPTGPSTTGRKRGAAGTTSTQVVLAPAAANGNGNGNGGNDNCVEPSNGNGNCVKTFGVKVGQTPLLYPTVTRNLPVTYSNPNSFDIEVTTYRVSVTVPASKTAICPASSLLVPAGTVTLSPRITLAKKGSSTTTIPISLGANAPEGCQDVTFSVTVDASAVKK